MAQCRRPQERWTRRSLSPQTDRRYYQVSCPQMHLNSQPHTDVSTSSETNQAPITSEYRLPLSTNALTTFPVCSQRQLECFSAPKSRTRRSTHQIFPIIIVVQNQLMVRVSPNNVAVTTVRTWFDLSVHPWMQPMTSSTRIPALPMEPALSTSEGKMAILLSRDHMMYSLQMTRKSAERVCWDVRISLNQRHPDAQCSP